MQPIPDLPDSFRCFHLLFCLFGIHTFFLLCDLWTRTVVIAPFGTYRRKNPWGLTGGLEEMCGGGLGGKVCLVDSYMISQTSAGLESHRRRGSVAIWKGRENRGRGRCLNLNSVGVVEVTFATGPSILMICQAADGHEQPKKAEPTWTVPLLFAIRVSS